MTGLGTSPAFVSGENPKSQTMERQNKMPRIPPVDDETAAPAARELLREYEEEMGMTPNFHRTLAHSPAALRAYLLFIGALSEGALDRRIRRRIAIAVSETSGCRYSLSAHAALGRTEGLTPAEVLDSRRGLSPDRRIEAALRFAKRVARQGGQIDDHDLELIRRSGHQDGEILEIVANVITVLLESWVNQIAGTEEDYPPQDCVEIAVD